MIVQTIAYGSQYLIGTTWDQPEFIANLTAAYLATLASDVAISVLHWLKVSSFETGMVCSRRLYKMARDLWHSPRNDDGENGDEEELQRVESNGSSVYLSQHETTTSIDTASHQHDKNGSGVESILPTNSSSTSTMQRRSNTTSQHSNNLEQGVPLNSDTIGFVDTALTGYVGDDEVTYARTDLWFCLMPALYLLVPGSKILQTGFMEMLGAFVRSEDHEEDNYDALASSLVVIGLGQVIGLRLGFVTLWLFNVVLKWMINQWGCCKKDNE